MEREPDPSAEDAARALAALAQARWRMAQRAHWPLWRHIAFGALMGMLVASYALPTSIQPIGVVLALLCTFLLVRYDRRRDGFFINGYRAGRTRRIALQFVAVALVGLVIAIVAKFRFGLVWGPLVVGAILVILGTLSSLAWERAYRADLAETP